MKWSDKISGAKIRSINREAAYDEITAAEWAEWTACLASEGVDLASVKPESMQSRSVRLGLSESMKR